ncbi:MAG: hypothetical protein HC915_17445 [Anaerolineae bacterium]|nr:hypothetical protein [Anaerolineae bacterium]
MGWSHAASFLPGFAVDAATLQSTLEAGFAFAVLRDSQVAGRPKRGGAGPYALRLPSGDVIHIFVANDVLSADMQEDLENRCGAGHWARRTLGSHFRHAGPLTLLYVDGHQLGSNAMGEHHFIHYLMDSEARAVAFQPTTLEAFYNDNRQPLGEIELLPQELAETPAQRTLRDALHDLMTEMSLVFAEAGGDDAWQRRDRLFELHLGHEPLFRSQVMLQRAWATTAWLGEAPVQHVLDCAALAVLLLNQATQTDLSGVLLDRLPAAEAEACRTSLDRLAQSAPQEEAARR